MPQLYLIYYYNYKVVLDFERRYNLDDYFKSSSVIVGRDIILNCNLESNKI